MEAVTGYGTKDLVEAIGGISGGVLAVIGFLRYVYPRFRNAYHSIRMPSRWHDRFGPDAPGIVHECLENLRREQERCERQSEEAFIRLSILEQRAGIGIYFCDESGACIGVNEYLIELFGISTERLLGNGWAVAIDEQDRARVVTEWRDFVQRNIPYSARYKITNAITRRRYEISTEAKPYNVGGQTLYIGFLYAASLDEQENE